MKQKLYIISLTLLFLVIFFIGNIAIADTWSNYVTITISDNTAAARTGLPILTGINSSSLISSGYLDASGNQTRLDESDTSKEYEVHSGNFAVFVENLAALQSRTYKFYMNYVPAVAQKIITGWNGYVTINDDNGLELRNNFTIEQSGWINTDISVVGGNITSKSGAFRTYIPSTGNITSIMYSAIAPTVETLRPDGIGDEANIDSVLPALSPHWQVESDNNEATYVYNSSLVWQRDLYTVGNHSTGKGVIDSVKVVAWLYDNNPGPRFVHGRTALRTDGTTVDGAINSKNGNITYLEISETYNTNPVIGGAWTWSQVDTLQAGVSLKIDTAGDIAYSEEVFIKVTWHTDNKQVSSILSSGSHIVKTITESDNLSLYIDNILKDSVELVGASVPLNANNWIIGSNNNTIGYLDYYKHTVNSTLQAWYEPLSMISGTTLPDRATTVVQNGIITWGTNPSGVVITIGAITSFASSTASVSDTSVSDTVSPLVQPSKWFNPADAGIINLPFYDTFAEKATEMGMPTRSLYAIMMLGVAAAVGLSILLFTGSSLILIIGIFFTIFAAVSTNVLDGWILFVFIFLALPILYLSRQS